MTRILLASKEFVEAALTGVFAVLTALIGGRMESDRRQTLRRIEHLESELESLKSEVEELKEKE